MRPSRRKVSAESDSRDNITARRGARVATTTEVIGDGDWGGAGREKTVESAASSTRNGANTRRTNSGVHTIVVGIAVAARSPELAIVVVVVAILDVADVLQEKREKGSCRS